MVANRSAAASYLRGSQHHIDQLLCCLDADDEHKSVIWSNLIT